MEEETNNKEEQYVCPGLIFNTHDKRINDFFVKKRWFTTFIFYC